MLDYARQARIALSVYLARRKAALAGLESGKYEDAQVMLRKATEAFHNFRAADAAALKTGCDVGSDKEIQGLLHEIREVGTRLERMMQDVKSRTSSEIIRVNRERMLCRKFRSGSDMVVEQGCFERSV